MPPFQTASRGKKITMVSFHQHSVSSPSVALHHGLCTRPVDCSVEPINASFKQLLPGMIGIATPIGYVSIKSVSLSWQLSPSSIASPTITLSQNLMWSALVVSRLYVTSVLSFIDKSTFRQLTPCVRTQSPPQSRTSRGPS